MCNGDFPYSQIECAMFLMTKPTHTEITMTNSKYTFPPTKVYAIFFIPNNGIRSLVNIEEKLPR